MYTDAHCPFAAGLTLAVYQISDMLWRLRPMVTPIPTAPPWFCVGPRKDDLQLCAMNPLRYRLSMSRTGSAHSRPASWPTWPKPLRATWTFLM
ncbi:hypothetical protein FKM82_029397 [Ascaphus truei]